jgi:hypothetical protein
VLRDIVTSQISGFALIIMRVRRPNAARNFRIPGGWWGITAVCVTFFAGAFLAIAATMREWRAYPASFLWSHSSYRAESRCLYSDAGKR